MLCVGSFPDFGRIFTITKPQRADGLDAYYKDDRNMLEIFFEWMEMSGM